MNNAISTVMMPLRRCNECSSTSVLSTRNQTWEECFVLNCPNCENKWYICPVHNKRFGIKSFGRMNKHFRDKHSYNLCGNQINNNNTQDDGSYEDNDVLQNLDYDSDNTASPKKRSIIKESNESGVISKKAKIFELFKSNDIPQYFIDEFNEEGKGSCGLVGNAFQMSTKGSYAPVQETLFHLELTNFLTNFTVKNQLKIISLMNRSRNIKLESTRIPRSMKDMNNFYMKSKYSIYKNIPIPKIIPFDNHACVSIEDLINNVLCIGLPIQMIRSSKFNEIEYDNSSLLNTQKTKEILMQTHKKHQNKVDPFVILLVIWSDDFEVNSTRKNKSSTWLKTVTFVHDTSTSSTDMEFTFALCLGNKSDSHFMVNRRYSEELIKLNDVIYKYSSIHKEYIPIVTRVLVMSADRPERCSLNDIASFSSSSTKRWMYSNGSDPHKMASCVHCFKRRVCNLFSLPCLHFSECKKCSDFDYSKEIPTNAFAPPKDYPINDMSDDFSRNTVNPPIGREAINKLQKGYLYPLELSYELLSQGLRYALFNYLSGVWKKRQTVVYLKILGMKDNSINQMMETSFINMQSTQKVMDAILQTNFPPMWSSVLTLDQFIETPMHHLFEGIVKACIDILILYMKYHKKWSKFARLMNEILIDVSSMNLDFCAADSFSNEEDFKTGGWLAETYLAFSRVMIIIIGHLDEFINPNELGFLEIQTMFQVLFTLLSHLMSTSMFDIQTIDDYIKLFLSICHFYEKDIGFETLKNGSMAFPFWYSKSNFVSLLNLKKQIETYGPVRLHWEGLKEKFIQKVKPILKNKTTRVTYLVKKMEKIYSHTNLEVIVNKQIPNNSFCKYEKIYDIQRFKSIAQIENSLSNFESISGIVLKDSPNRIYIINEQNDSIKLHKVLICPQDRFLKLNLWYYSVMIKEKPNYIFNDYRSLVEEIHDYVMIIPYYPGHTDETKNNGYTVVSKNWYIYSIEDGFDRYKPCLNFIEEIIRKNE